MKRAVRDRALNRLYAELQSENFDDREYALFQLMLMLRRANDGMPCSGRFSADDQLPRDLKRIRLSPSDQKQIVAMLMRLVPRHAGSQASAFWTLGEVSANYAFSHALSAIGEYGEHFTDESAYQVCRALQNWLTAEDSDTNLGAALLADKKALRLLNRWSQSTDPRLTKRAKSVISRARGLS